MVTLALQLSIKLQNKMDQYKSVLDSEDRKKLQRLKKDLSGHMAEVARRVGISRMSMIRILNGEQSNPKALDTAIEYRNNLKTEIKESLSRI